MRPEDSHLSPAFRRCRRQDGEDHPHGAPLGMDGRQCDEHYSGDELVWTSKPNQFLVAEVVGLPVGRAVDLACGEGRNLSWLARARRGCDGVDLSVVGLTKADGSLASGTSRSLDLWRAGRRLLEGSISSPCSICNSPNPARSASFAVAASAAGGTLLVVAHDQDNLTRVWRSTERRCALPGERRYECRGRRRVDRGTGRAGGSYRGHR